VTEIGILKRGRIQGPKQERGDSGKSSRIEEALQFFTATHHPWDISHTHEWAPTTRHRHVPNPPHSPTSLTEPPSPLHTPWTRPGTARPGPDPARYGPVPARPRPGKAQALHGPAHGHRNLRLPLDRSSIWLPAQTHRVHAPLSGIAGSIRLHLRLLHDLDFHTAPPHTAPHALARSVRLVLTRIKHAMVATLG
jgi:hypothetical protein